MDRNAGRLQIGMTGDIISESVGAFPRNRQTTARVLFGRNIVRVAADFAGVGIVEGDLAFANVD
jgi:hypothetical protein